jgi:hydrogenase nickel incorporation protein HypA/HybF
MHEFSLCEGIIKQVSRANDQRLDNLEQVTIEVGKLAGVDVDSLCFWFPVVAAKLNCQHLKLELHEISGKAHCRHCDQDFELINLYDPCSNCNTHGEFDIVQGRELLVKSFTRLSVD